MLLLGILSVLPIESAAPFIRSMLYRCSCNNWPCHLQQQPGFCLIKKREALPPEGTAFTNFLICHLKDSIPPPDFVCKMPFVFFPVSRVFCTLLDLIRVWLGKLWNEAQRRRISRWEGRAGGGGECGLEEDIEKSVATFNHHKIITQHNSTLVQMQNECWCSIDLVGQMKPKVPSRIHWYPLRSCTLPLYPFPLDNRPTTRKTSLGGGVGLVLGIRISFRLLISLERKGKRLRGKRG